MGVSLGWKGKSPGEQRRASLRPGREKCDRRRGTLHTDGGMGVDWEGRGGDTFQADEWRPTGQRWGYRLRGMTCGMGVDPHGGR